MVILITTKHLMNSVLIGNRRISLLQEITNHVIRTSTGATTPHPSTSTVSTHLLKEATDNHQAVLVNPEMLETHQVMLPVVTPTTMVSASTMPTPTT